MSDRESTCALGDRATTPNCRHITCEMSMQAEEHNGKAIGVEQLTTVGASVFGHLVWPQVYNEFVCAEDHVTWPDTG